MNETSNTSASASLSDNIFTIEEARKQALSENISIKDFLQQGYNKGKKETAEAIFRDLDEYRPTSFSCKQDSHCWIIFKQIDKLKEKYLGQECGNGNDHKAKNLSNERRENKSCETPDARKGCEKPTELYILGHNITCGKKVNGSIILCPSCSGESKWYFKKYII